MTTGVYQIVNKTNGKLYIGSSSNLVGRKASHYSSLRSKNHGNSHLQNAYNKYGAANFEFKVLIYCDIKDMIFYENLLIAGFKANKKEFGYNARVAAETNRGMIRESKAYRPGDTYGKLTLIARADNVPGSMLWRCECNCGNETVKNVTDMKLGSISSCGCFRKETTGKLNRKYKPGDKFNRLTIVKIAKITKSRPNIWECVCDCGNIKNVCISALVQQNTKSCGCLATEDKMTKRKHIKFVVIDGERMTLSAAERHMSIHGAAISGRVKRANVTHQEAAMYFHRKNLLKEFREVGDEITRRAA